MKKIQSKMKAQERSQNFFHRKYIKIFVMFKGSLLYSSWSNLAKFRTSKVVLLTRWENEEDLIQNESPRVLTRLYINLRQSRAANSALSGIQPKFKLVEKLMIFII